MRLTIETRREEVELGRGDACPDAWQGIEVCVTNGWRRLAYVGTSIALKTAVLTLDSPRYSTTRIALEMARRRIHDTGRIH